MIQFGAKLSRTATRFARSAKLPSISTRSSPLRSLHHGIDGSKANPVALQMINYALSHARSTKSDDSYGQGLIVLEQCLSTQPRDDSRALVLMAMSTLLSERGNFNDAIEKLKSIQDLSLSSVGVRVAAMEALVGLCLELGLDDTSSVFADKCLAILQENESESDGGKDEILRTRAKVVKGLVELVHGNLQSAEILFLDLEDDKRVIGTVALSYGEYLHSAGNFSLAKKLYESVIEQLSEREDFRDSYSLGACNMSPEEVLLAATCALGQLEGQSGNFGVAEVTLTQALTKAEEHFGSRHPKVGVVLSCIALMYRQKSMQERSSSLLIQEGLYRKALELLEAPPLDTEEMVAVSKVARSDVIALARGGYGEALCVQQNRKDEGMRMKNWAEAAWRNRRLSLAEALEISEPASKTLIVDTRICRAL